MLYPKLNFKSKTIAKVGIKAKSAFMHNEQFLKQYSDNPKTTPVQIPTKKSSNISIVS